MSVQNPTIPTPTDPKGIDLVVSDLQTLLDINLVWLTNGMGRAYRLSKVRANQTTVFLPEVYLGGANRYDYFAATPDNDKQGQNIFFVGDATLPNQQKGFYGWVEHDVGIIFSANLETIDSALLVTEDFTEHLVQDVREVLIRGLLGKGYRVNIDSITREFDDVYAEFDVSRDRGIAHAPMTHFRFNCTITFKEDCAGVSLNRCAAILQNLSNDDLLNCILPTYDFSTASVQDATSLQQQNDMKDWLCSSAGAPSSINIDGIGQFIEIPSNAAYEFTTSSQFTVNMFVKIRTQQTNNMLNKYNSSTRRGIFLQVNALNKINFNINSDLLTKSARIETTNAIPLNTWVNITWVYKSGGDVSNLEIYLNGVLQTVSVINNTLSVGDIITDPALNIYLCSNQTGGGIDGVIHEFKMWDTTLSSTDITADINNVLDFNNGISGTYTPVKEANLIHRNRTGADDVYGVRDWCFRDYSGTVSGSQSTLLEENDKSEIDIPLSL